MTRIRPAVIAVPLFAVLTAGAVTAATHAAAPAKARADQQLCIVISQDANHQHTQYYCIDWDGLAKQ
jgi:hypothetical protein